MTLRNFFIDLERGYINRLSLQERRDTIGIARKSIEKITAIAPRSIRAVIMIFVIAFTSDN